MKVPSWFQFSMDMKKILLNKILNNLPARAPAIFAPGILTKKIIFFLPHKKQQTKIDIYS